MRYSKWINHWEFKRIKKKSPPRVGNDTTPSCFYKTKVLEYLQLEKIIGDINPNGICGHIGNDKTLWKKNMMKLNYLNFSSKL